MGCISQLTLDERQQLNDQKNNSGKNNIGNGGVCNHHSRHADGVGERMASLRCRGNISLLVKSEPFLLFLKFTIL